MRIFTPKEKDFLNNLVLIKKKGKLEELQLMRLLRIQLNTLAIRWVLEPKCSIQIYAQFKNPTVEQWRDIQKKYFEIADYIYLIEELFEYKLIKLQEVSFENPTQENHRVLYDQDKYSIEGDSIFEKSNKNNCLYALSDICKHKVNVTFAHDLEKYANSIIYPLPLLYDLINHDFRDLERIQLEEARTNNRKTLCNTYTSLKQTRCSIIISVVAVVISCLAIIAPLLYEIFWSNNPNSTDVQEIKTAIEQNKNISIDLINSDTINVKVADTPGKQPINLNVTVKGNQPVKVQ